MTWMVLRLAVQLRQSHLQVLVLVLTLMELVTTGGAEMATIMILRKQRYRRP